MTIREWIGGGFLVVISLLMWKMIADLNGFMRTTLTDKLTQNAVMQSETKSAIQLQTEKIENSNDALKDEVKDLSTEIRGLSEILRNTHDAHPRPDH